MITISDRAALLLADLRAALEAAPDDARSFVIPMNLNATTLPIIHNGFPGRHRDAPRGVIDELLQAHLVRRSAPFDRTDWRHEITALGHTYGLAAPGSTGLSPRDMMRRAVEVMRLSKPELGKMTPLVGAAVLLADDTVVAAHRAELRNGDHAEFTLFERKLHNRPLDGARLFVTLEPCAPGSRSKEKTACAQRIVDARIAEIWIGIEDPYPTVAGKGTAFLQDAGVAVHPFDSDSVEVIREANKAFIAYALEATTRVASTATPAVSPKTDQFPVSMADQANRAAVVKSCERGCVGGGRRRKDQSLWIPRPRHRRQPGQPDRAESRRKKRFRPALSSFSRGCKTYPTISLGAQTRTRDHGGRDWRRARNFGRNTKRKLLRLRRTRRSRSRNSVIGRGAELHASDTMSR